jgi:hypothetical protein
MHIHLTINSNIPAEGESQLTCTKVQASESENARINNLAKTIFVLLQINKTVGGFSQAAIARAVQQVHDDVLNTAKIDNKFQKDTFNAICAFANRVAQEKGFDSAWFAREKIYRPLMEK